MPRSSLMVSKESALALANDASTQGKPLYNVTNDVVKIYLRAKQKGYDLGEVLETYEAMDMLRKMGFTMVSETLFESLVMESVPNNPSAYIAICERNGKRMGMFARSSCESPTEAINKFSHLFPDIHFHVCSEGEKNTLYVACPRRSITRTSLLAHLIKGFLEAFDCFVHRSDVFEGLVKIEFSKSSTV